MKNLMILCAFLFHSCSRLSTEEIIIKDTLGTKIHLNGIDSIKSHDQIIPLSEFRNQYKYIYLVFLKHGCTPCYPKFIEWQTQMDRLCLPENFTVLYIYQGLDFNSFLEDLLNSDPNYIHKDDSFYFAVDYTSQFITNNSELSNFILNKSFLIDDKYKIRLIGTPFASEPMLEVFFRITQ